MEERSVLKSEMPQVEMQICLFHVLKIFNREVTREKMGVTPAEQDTIKSLVQECCYAHGSEDFMKKYEVLMNVGNDKVKNYYNNNWHTISDNGLKV